MTKAAMPQKHQTVKKEKNSSDYMLVNNLTAPPIQFLTLALYKFIYLLTYLLTY